MVFCPMTSFIFNLTDAEVKVISEALAEMPYKDVVAVVNKMQAQINSALAAVTVEPKPQE